MSGKPYKKPTGWATNVKEIADRLSRRCDGNHRHELVLGSNQGGSRAAQAQHYPDQLIDEILKGYTDYLGDEQKVNYVEYPAILRQIETEQQREQRVGREVLAVEEIEPRSQDEPMVGNQGRPDDMPDIEESIKRLPRERAFSMEHLVRRAHEGLGHPGNDRLARILKSAGARKEAVDYAKQLQCAVCDQHRKTRAPRQAAPPRELHVNSIVGADTVYLPTWDKKTRPALNIVCWASRFQLVVPLSGPNPVAARRACLQWIKFLGPPEKLYVDLGKEFGHPFNLGAEGDATLIEPSALEMPTQRSITERAGKNFKEVFEKALTHHAVQSEEEWLQLVDITMMTVNRLTNKSGFSPVQRVLGYTPRSQGA